jgi:hypothetical protein
MPRLLNKFIEEEMEDASSFTVFYGSTGQGDGEGDSRFPGSPESKRESTIATASAARMQDGEGDADLQR